MDIAGLYIVSYLVGSIPTAYIIARLVKKVDLRRYGSGNVGSSNLFYHVSRKWVLPLGLFEVLIKGALPVLAGHYLLGLERTSGWLMVAPLLAITGNNWSVFLRLQGGRGIAVTGGALLALSPVLLVASAVIAIGGWRITKSSGLWVLISLALLPLWAYLVQDNLNLVWYCLGLLGIVVLKRLSSNWTPFPEGVPRKRVLFNRLVRDRDLSDRTRWVRRIPEGSS